MGQQREKRIYKRTQEDRCRNGKENRKKIKKSKRQRKREDITKMQREEKHARRTIQPPKTMETDQTRLLDHPKGPGERRKRGTHIRDNDREKLRRRRKEQDHHRK
jgi:hypothetical protein